MGSGWVWSRIGICVGCLVAGLVIGGISMAWETREGWRRRASGPLGFMAGVLLAFAGLMILTGIVWCLFTGFGSWPMF